MTGVLLAVGDSITADADDPRAVLGVPDRSWALWLGDAIGLEVVRVAWGGATAPDLVPATRELAPCALGCVYVGVNDVRSPRWDAGAYEEALGAIADAVAACAERVLLLGAPLDLGRPPAGAKVAELNAIIAAQAARIGASFCALADVGGRTLVWPDTVHPTARGQLEIARRAARALGAPPPPEPPHPTRRATARDRIQRWAPAAARDRARRAVERLRYLIRTS